MMKSFSSFAKLFLKKVSQVPSSLSKSIDNLSTALETLLPRKRVAHVIKPFKKQSHELVKATTRGEVIKVRNVRYTKEELREAHLYREKPLIKEKRPTISSSNNFGGA